jgi:hypothetical protein
MRIIINGGREPITDGLIEAQAAAIQENLVDVLCPLLVFEATTFNLVRTYCRPNSPEQTSRALVL